MYIVILRELGQLQPGYPIVLLMGHKKAQVMLQYEFNPLSLSFRLQMVARREARPDLQSFEEVLSHLRDELGSSIRNNLFLQAIARVNLLDEQGGRVFSQEGVIAREEFGHFCEPVHNYRNDIIPLAAEEAGDEIHAKGQPRAFRLLQRHEFARGLVIGRFSASTSHTALHESFDLRVHARLGEIPFHQVYKFLAARVAGKQVIVRSL